MNIDWSKAPEGCLEIGKNQWDELAWLCVDGYIYLHCNGCMVNWATPRALKRSDFHVFDIRPEEEWTGEGLPPVGTVCEFAGFNPEETMPTDPRVGDQVTVIAHFMSGSFEVAAFTFYAPPEFEYLQVAQGAYGCFRPVRTPEQIAEEEREKAVQAAIEDTYTIGISDQSKRILIERLYDAGYRKQSQP